MALKKVDAVIVGVGWVGGIIAHELTKQGLSVVGLERGRTAKRSTVSFQDDHDELRYAIRNELFQNAANETWSLRHNLGETALPMRQLGSFLPGTGLGGAGVHWNGQTWRFHPRDFTAYTSTVERYGKAAMPADMSLQDWGITYDELEPYYDRFEYMAGIAGKAGNINGRLIPGGNVFEGPRSREFPVQAQAATELSAMFQKATSDLGYHPFPGPSANLPVPYKNPDGVTRGQCTYCGFCERFGCEVGAKADPTVTVIPLALKTGKFEIRGYSHAYAIKNDGKTGTERPLLRRVGSRPGAARRHHHPRRVRVQQRAHSAPLEARNAVRREQGDRHRRTQLLLPDGRRRGQWMVHGQAFQALHGLWGAGDGDRRLQRR